MLSCQFGCQFHRRWSQLLDLLADPEVEAPHELGGIVTVKQIRQQIRTIAANSVSSSLRKRESRHCRWVRLSHVRPKT